MIYGYTSAEIKKIIQLLLDNKLFIMSGRNGIGKTHIITFILNKLNYNIIPVDIYQSNITEKLSSIILRDFFTNKKNIILIDNVSTNIPSKHFTEINNYVKKSKIPLILICDDIYIKELKTLEKKGYLYKLSPSTKLISTQLKLEYNFVKSYNNDIRHLMLNKQVNNKDERFNIFQIYSQLIKSENPLDLLYQVIPHHSLLKQYLYGNFLDNISEETVNILDDLTLVDQVDTFINTNNDYSLMPFSTSMLLKPFYKLNKSKFIKYQTFPKINKKLGESYKESIGKISYDIYDIDKNIKKGKTKKSKTKKGKTKKSKTKKQTKIKNETDINKMNLSELKKYCKSKKIKGYSKLKKKDLIQYINNYDT
jgi:hypothetical protein